MKLFTSEFVVIASVYRYWILFSDKLVSAFEKRANYIGYSGHGTNEEQKLFVTC
jgi:hypothetical protein